MRTLRSNSPDELYGLLLAVDRAYDPATIRKFVPRDAGAGLPLTSLGLECLIRATRGDAMDLAELRSHGPKSKGAEIAQCLETELIPLGLFERDPEAPSDTAYRLSIMARMGSYAAEIKGGRGVAESSPPGRYLN